MVKDPPGLRILKASAKMDLLTQRGDSCATCWNRSWVNIKLVLLSVVVLLSVLIVLSIIQHSTYQTEGDQVLRCGGHCGCLCGLVPHHVLS
jgi:type II secretory pathway component PulL